MKINLDFAEVSAPLFLNGKNCGVKLKAGGSSGFTLVYDRANKELLVSYGGVTGIVPTSRVEHMTPSDQSQFTTGPMVAPNQQQQSGKMSKFNSNPSAKAQVSSPTSHVFEER